MLKQLPKFGWVQAGPPVCVEIDAALIVKGDALRLEQRPLDGGPRATRREADGAAGVYDPLPGDVAAVRHPAKRPADGPRRSGIPQELCDLAVGSYPAWWDGTHDTGDLVEERS
jgi:hypothetical protein